jgi:phage protein U
MPMLTLGTFVFHLRSLPFQELQRKTAWRHAASNRVTARPAHQYVGPGEDTIELTGTVQQELTPGEISLNTLRELADAGAPLPLVDGRGYVLGAWVIQDVQEKKTVFFKDGAPRQVEFGLSLLRVDEANLQQDASGLF